MITENNQVNFGGIIPVSSIDWYGRASMVIFFRGCPFHCIYCHNRELQGGKDFRDIDYLKEYMMKAKEFVSVVVFSGGEPTMQYNALKTLSEYARKLDWDIGIYTNGYYPKVIERLYLQSLVDKVFLSIKAPLNYEFYKQITQSSDKDVIDKILKTIKILKRYKIDTEIIIPIYKPQLGNEVECYYRLIEIIVDIIGDLKYTLVIQNVEGCGKKYTVQELRNIGLWLKEINKYMNIKIRTKENGWKLFLAIMGVVYNE